MAYDHDLADDIRELLAEEPGITEQPMFGGLAFLVNGTMALAASGRGGLLVRVDPAHSESLVDGVHVTPMVMRDRPMRGWLDVDAAVRDDDDRLAHWVTTAVGYARSLPPKRSG